MLGNLVPWLQGGDSLPVIVFLHGDHTGQPHGELNKLVDYFLETSCIVFGIRGSRSPNLHYKIGEDASGFA